MTPSTALTERLLQAFQTPADGVLGCVNELLAVALEQDVQLTWHAGQCRIQFPSSGVVATLPLPKPVFRAVLARLAALCNEHELGSVTPYRGTGTLVIAPLHKLCVQFLNQPEELHVGLTAIPEPPSDGRSVEHPLPHVADGQATVI